MASYNKIILIGRLTKDPELRYTPTGVPVGNFTLAVDRTRGKDKETDFIDIVVWQKLAEICQQYLKKGKLVMVEGRLQIRTYEAQDGQKRKAVEVIANEMQMLDKLPARTEEGGGSVPTAVGVGAAQSNVSQRTDEPSVTDDVPF